MESRVAAGGDLRRRWPAGPGGGWRVVEEVGSQLVCPSCGCWLGPAGSGTPGVHAAPLDSRVDSCANCPGAHLDSMACGVRQGGSARPARLKALAISAERRATAASSLQNVPTKCRGAAWGVGMGAKVWIYRPVGGAS